MKYDAEAFNESLISARRLGREAMQLLAEDHLPLVAAMVRRFPPCPFEREELYQQGCIGLMKALARFDPACHTAFSTYAAAMIFGEMRMLCRQNAPVHVPRTDRALRSRIRHVQDELTSRLGREPTVQEIAQTLRTDASELVCLMEQITVTSIHSPSGKNLLDFLPDENHWMDRLLLRDILIRLPEDDHRLYLLRYRLGKTQRETALSMGLSQVQVSRREAALKRRIRHLWLEAE